MVKMLSRRVTWKRSKIIVSRYIFAATFLKGAAHREFCASSDSSEDIIDKLIDEVSEDTKDKPSDVDHI